MTAQKYIFLISIVLLSFSCDKGDNDNLGNCEPIMDYTNTLAGSVSGYMTSPDMEIAVSLGGMPLGNDIYGELLSEGVDDELSLDISLLWENETYIELSVPVIPIFGKKGDVVFDHSSADATILSGTRDLAADDMWHNLIEFTPVDISVGGWIKWRDLDDISTRCSMATAQFDYDIYVECEVDGKPLNLHITGL